MEKVTKEEIDEIKQLEESYNKQIMEIALYENKLSPPSVLPKYNKIKVDESKLYKQAVELLSVNSEVQNKDIAIELLKNISINSKSKFMRKIALEMLKEKWWDK
ncbi:hypothetical protein [Planococcus maitriensis]|uniref:Uncharacterized protein n=1 Tax=Planococcus maitriensis TaxID=221799 RepID=A0A365K3Q1_9BACL|nr:hypothetical protein [Planococcus maitriensis]RAZ67266.1 hypothetical protein DP119_10905 [Planococcus maitriensis]